MSLRLSALLLLALGANGCAATNVAFHGTTHPELVDRGSYVKVVGDVIPDHWPVIGRVSADCEVAVDGNVVGAVVDGPCYPEALQKKMRTTIAKSGGNVMAQFHCTESERLAEESDANGNPKEVLYRGHRCDAAALRVIPPP